MNRQRSIIGILALLIISALGTGGSLLYATEKYRPTVTSYNLPYQEVEQKHYSSIAEYYAYPVHITLKNKVSVTFGNILPIYIKDKGWVRAELVKKGDTVLFYEEGKTQYLTITKIRHEKEFHQFYTYVNVADNSNYFRDGVLVHNMITDGNGREYPPNWKPESEDDEDLQDAQDVAEAARIEAARIAALEKKREEDALQAAKVKLAMLEQMGAPEALRQQAKDSVKYAQKELDTGNYARAADVAGDPVLITTGRFVFEETDVFLKSGLTRIAVNRFYISGNTQVYSMGQGWATMLDSRLIRGIIKDAFVASQSLEEDMLKLKALQLELTRHMAYGSAQNAYDTIQNQYDATKDIYKDLVKDANRATALATLNEYVVSSETPENNYNIGNGNLTYIDTKGNVIRFNYMENGEWKPLNTEKAQYMKIISRDRKDSLSEAGFILYEKGGIETWFDKWGLIEKKLDRSKNITLYVRYPDKKKLQKIVSAEGREIKFTYTDSGLLKSAETTGGEKVVYGYRGTMLSSVTDTQGDTSLYEYDAQGYLKKFIKPDGTYISFNYDMMNKDGEKLTTSTTNEENETELFDYYLDAQLTTYTDYSGVKTYIHYDEKHRTTKEISADGTITEYIYDDTTGNILSQTVNGDRTQYSHDGRGNKILATYSDKSAETWKYNHFDQIVKYTDRDGILQELQYDTSGNATDFSIAKKVVMRSTYDTKGNITTSTDYASNKTTYSYDLVGNMVKRNSSGAIETFEYDGQNRVISYTDPEDRRWEYEYTAKTITEKAQNGLQTIYTYNNRKDLVQILETDRMGTEKRITELQYDARHLIETVRLGDKVFYTYAYNPAGKIETETIGESEKEEYWVNKYKYDSSGKLYAIQATKYNKNGIQEGSTYTESYEYARTTQGEVQTRISPLNRRKSYSFDRWNRVTAMENALGEKLLRTVSSAGRAQTEQSLHGGWYQYDYDGAGRLDFVAEKGGKGVQVLYNTDGTLAQKTDQKGNTTLYTYNEQRLLMQESSEERNVFYQYDKVGRVRQVVVGSSANISTAEQYTDYSYSADGRTVQITYGGKYTKVWTLNAWGDVIGEQDGEGNTQTYEYNKQGQLVKALDAYGNASNYEYNALGKVKSITYPDATTTEYKYNHLGYVQIITDSEGIQWKGDYDEAGRLIRERGRPGIDRQYTYDKLDRIKTVSIADILTERYSYTEKGAQVTFKDGKDADYIYTKNNFGRLVSEQNRLEQSQSYTYDDSGQLKGKVDFANKTTEMGYDVENRTQTIRYADGTQNILRYNMTGQIIEAIGSTGIIHYTYDKAGLLETQTDQEGGETSYYTYDNAGRRIKLFSGNREISYTYGKNGELLEVGDNIQRLFVNYTYDVMSRETARTFGNGVQQHTVYDSIGRTTLITEKSPTGEILRAEGYLYNAEGQRTHGVNEHGQVTKYLYDVQGRLETVYYPYSEEKALADKQEAAEAGLFFTLDKGIPENLYLTSEESRELKILLEDVSFGRSSLLTVQQNVWKESYTYDANSNRLTKTTSWGTVDYRYDSENHLLHSGVEGNGTAFSYDANGNLLTKQNDYKTEQYAYNGLNRMIESLVTDHVDKTQTTSNYGYDAFGRRTLVQDAGFETMRTLYDGQSFDIIRENAVFAGGDFTTNYIQGNDILYSPSEATGERYRFIEESTTDGRYRNIDGYTNARSRFTGTKTALYAKGESVAVNRSASTGSTSGRAYFGTDILGSVRSATTDSATIEDRYEYDAFGTPYKGDFTTGLDKGYTGKPYDATTGLYNYGYRDYRPQTARFTTVDPIRDGNNWFSYVVNDPVNYVDLWGLEIVATNGTFKQQDFGKDEKLGNSDTESARAAGCLVVAYSDAVSAITGDAGITPSATNNDDSNFTSDKTGNMDVKTATQNDGLVHDWWTKDTQGNLNEKINEVADSTQRGGVVAKVPYNDEGNTHWVTVQGGTVIRDDDIEYVPVKGSSKNDDVVGNRPSGWKFGSESTGDAGIIYIPVNQVQKIHTMVEKSKND